MHQIIKFFEFQQTEFTQNHMILFLNINILILYYASMQSEIDGPGEIDSLKICIIRLEFKNDKIKVENNKIMAENVKLKARVAKLKNKQL